MKIEYKIEFSADLGNVFSPIGDLLKRVNDGVASAGYDEKLMLRGKPFHCIVTSEHELKDDEIDKMKQIITEQFNTMQPAWRVKVKSFRRKSGNVLQSVKQ